MVHWGGATVKGCDCGYLNALRCVRNKKCSKSGEAKWNSRVVRFVDKRNGRMILHSAQTLITPFELVP